MSAANAAAIAILPLLLAAALASFFPQTFPALTAAVDVLLAGDGPGVRLLLGTGIVLGALMGVGMGRRSS